jgi:2'-5' RNA ligase
MGKQSTFKGNGEIFMPSGRGEPIAESLRLFVGVRPDAATQRYLDSLVSYCKQQLTGRSQTRWLSPANRHLTLVFLGDTAAGLLPAIETKLGKIANEMPPCSGRLVSTHAFPNSRSRTLAAELLPNPELDRLHQRCRQMMKELGLTPESAHFRPHITLARSRRSFSRLPPLAADFSLRLTNIVLYQSQLSPGGSQYVPLFEAELITEGDKSAANKL